MKYKNIESVNWEEEFPEVPVYVQNAINDVKNEILARKSNKVKHFPRKRMLLLVAVITLLSGMTVMAAAGLWQQRMEAMNRQEIEEYFLTIATAKAPSFRYNRAMTREEKALFDELTYSYENEGVFPEGVLTMLSAPEEYRGKGIGYDRSSGTLFLPEKSLRREELLRIIDFYHKAEYAVVNMNATTGDEEWKALVKDALQWEETREETSEGTGLGDAASRESTVALLNYEPLNDKVSYCQIPMQGKELLIDVAANEEYLYLGFQSEIKRMPLGSDIAEAVYILKENEKLFAFNSDKDNNIYLSLREYNGADDSYTHRLRKLNEAGEVVTEYDLDSAVYQDGKTLANLVPYHMYTDRKGWLYVKGMWNEHLAVFVFDSEGNCLEQILSDEYGAHPANGMCFGEDGYLYTLAEDALVKVDTSTGKVADAYDYWADEMIAMTDIIYPLDEKSFYIFSYDGLFRYTIGEEGSERLLASYESQIFAEGCKHAPISQEELVVINMTDYEKFEYTITYLSLAGIK